MCKILGVLVCYRYARGYGMRFSVNFGHEIILTGNFLEFIGNGIGMPVKSGNKNFEIWVARNLH